MLSTSASCASRYSVVGSGSSRESAEDGTDRAQGRIAGELGERAAHRGGAAVRHRAAPLIASWRSDRVTRAPACAAPARTRIGRRATRSVRRRSHAPAAEACFQRAGERRRTVLAVAAEQFVGALAGQRDGHVLRRQLGEREEAERGQLGDGLVEVQIRSSSATSLVGHRELDLVVVGAEQAGDATRVREFVALAVLDEPDREGLHRVAVRCAPSARRSGSNRARRSASRRSARRPSGADGPTRSSCSRRPSLVLVDREPRPFTSAAAPDTLQYALDAKLAPLDHEPMARAASLLDAPPAASSGAGK